MCAVVEREETRRTSDGLVVGDREQVEVVMGMHLRRCSAASATG